MGVFKGKPKRKLACPEEKHSAKTWSKESSGMKPSEFAGHAHCRPWIKLFQTPKQFVPPPYWTCCVHKGKRVIHQQTWKCRGSISKRNIVIHKGDLIAHPPPIPFGWAFGGSGFEMHLLRRSSGVCLRRATCLFTRTYYWVDLLLWNSITQGHLKEAAIRPPGTQNVPTRRTLQNTIGPWTLSGRLRVQAHQRSFNS